MYLGMFTLLTAEFFKTLISVFCKTFGRFIWLFRPRNSDEEILFSSSMVGDNSGMFYHACRICVECIIIMGVSQPLRPGSGLNGQPKYLT